MHTPFKLVTALNFDYDLTQIKNLTNIKVVTYWLLFPVKTSINNPNIPLKVWHLMVQFQSHPFPFTRITIRNQKKTSGTCVVRNSNFTQVFAVAQTGTRMTFVPHAILNISGHTGNQFFNSKQRHFKTHL